MSHRPAIHLARHIRLVRAPRSHGLSVIPYDEDRDLHCTRLSHEYGDTLSACFTEKDHIASHGEQRRPCRAASFVAAQ
ncbi:hypothetical protein O1L55_36695 [Streptomyces albulus]|nr:hypothetical protein [Streptomyces noursei]